MQAMTATLFRHLNVFHDSKRNFKLHCTSVGGERRQFFVERRPLIKHAMLVLSTSVASETKNLITNIWVKLN